MKFVTKKGSQALERLASGAEQLLEAVGSTLGPAARTSAIFKRDFRPRLGWSDISSIFSSDGADLSAHFYVGDPFEQVAVDLLSEAARDTAAEVGDGTTSTVILAASMFIEGAKLVAAGHLPQKLVRGIQLGVQESVNFIRERARAITETSDLMGIARSASRGHFSEADAVLEGFQAAGAEGYVELGWKGGVAPPCVVISQHCELSGSVLASAGISFSPEGTYELGTPSLVFVEEPIGSSDQLRPRELLIEGASSPLVICVRQFSDFEQKAKSTGLTNSLLLLARRNNVKLLLVTSTDSGNWSDAAAYSGTRSLPSVPSKIDGGAVGSVSRLSCSGSKIRLFGPRVDSEAYLNKLTYLRERCQSAPESLPGSAKLHSAFDDQDDRYNERATDGVDAQRRLAVLVGKHVRVVFSGPQSSHRREVKDCMKNVLRSLMTARAGGWIPGGGEMFLRAARHLGSCECAEPDRFGVSVVRRALTQPLRWVASNAGKEPTTVAEEVSELAEGTGYDAHSEAYVDLAKAGIIDAAGTAVAVLRNSANTACFLLGISTVVGTVSGEEDLSDHDLSHMVRR